MIDHFGFLAPFYEHFIRARGPEPYLTYAQLPVKGKLLDVGGGTGRISQTLRNYCNQIVVVDESVKMLFQASKKNGLDLACARSEKLPFRDNSFDRVLMVDALHHVMDQRHTILELWRIVKPGGIIIIEEPEIQTFGVKLIAFAEKIALMRSHFLTARAIADLFPKQAAQIRTMRQGHNCFVVVEKGC